MEGSIHSDVPPYNDCRSVRRLLVKLHNEPVCIGYALAIAATVGAKIVILIKSSCDSG